MDNYKKKDGSDHIQNKKKEDVVIDWVEEDKKYMLTRETKFREVVMRLNTTHYIDRPFTVQIGELAAWLEFRVSNNPDAKPNQEILSQMIFSKSTNELDNRAFFSQFDNQIENSESNTKRETELDSERNGLVAKNLNSKHFKKISDSRADLLSAAENQKNTSTGNQTERETQKDWRYVNPIKKTEDDQENEKARERLSQMITSNIEKQ